MSDNYSAQSAMFLQIKWQLFKEREYYCTFWFTHYLFNPSQLLWLWEIYINMLFALNNYIKGLEHLSIAFFQSRGHVKPDWLWRLILTVLGPGLAAGSRKTSATLSLSWAVCWMADLSFPLLPQSPLYSVINEL